MPARRLSGPGGGCLQAIGLQIVDREAQDQRRREPVAGTWRRLAAQPIGNIPGAALGGLIIGILETMVVAIGFPQWRDGIAFAVLIVILLFKPTGILGRVEREKV